MTDKLKELVTAAEAAGFENVQAKIDDGIHYLFVSRNGINHAISDTEYEPDFMVSALVKWFEDREAA